MEQENLFTQYSRKRADLRYLMECGGWSETEIREALRFVLPREIRPLKPDVAEHPAYNDEPDTRWDVYDSEGKKPDGEEAHAAVQERLSALHKQFHSHTEE